MAKKGKKRGKEAVPPQDAPAAPAPPSRLEAPEEFEGIWDREIRTAYAALNAKQRLFTVEYVRCRFVGLQAYKRSYNPEASDDVAKVCASRLLTNVNIRTILKRLQDTSLEDMFLVRNTLVDALGAYKPEVVKNAEGKEVVRTDLPDFNARIKAASELKEFHKDRTGPQAPAGGVIPASFTTNFNFYLQQMGMEPVKLPAPQAVDAEAIQEENDIQSPESRAEQEESDIEEDFGASFRRFAGKK